MVFRPCRVSLIGLTLLVVASSGCAGQPYVQEVANPPTSTVVAITTPSEVLDECLEDPAVIDAASRALRDHEQSLLGEFKDLTVLLADYLGVKYESIVVDYIGTRTRSGNDASVTLEGMGQKFSDLSRDEFAALQTPRWTTTTTSSSQMSRYASMGVATYTFHACIASRLRVPDRVNEQIAATRAVDGIQIANFGDYQAQWSYHPDSGLRITYSLGD